MDERKTILVIDDYETSAAAWGLYLHNAQYSVETAYSPEEGLQLFATRLVDLVLLDYAMPMIDGGQVAATMKHIKPNVPILMLSGLPQVPDEDLAHIDAFIQKGQAGSSASEDRTASQSISASSVTSILREVTAWQFNSNFDKVLLSSWDDGVMELYCVRSRA